MGAYYTPNYEDDADFAAPILAHLGGVAGALYHWLHSRVEPTGNSIKLSIPFLAKKIGASESQVKTAVRALKREGLIEAKGHPGNGGGTVFALPKVRYTGSLKGAGKPVKQAGGRPLNGRGTAHDKYIEKKNTNKGSIKGESNGTEGKYRQGF